MTMGDLPLGRSGRGAYEVAVQAVREAGDIIMAHFHGEKRISYKEGRSNIVTDVDVLAEEKISALLQYEYPHFSIMTEESADIAGDSSYTWIIDPIDGTRNYAYGIPHFCVALALARGEELLLGISYDPVRKELFRAEKGQGAFLNDSPIAVSTRTSLGESLVGFDMGYDAEIGQEILGVASALWPGVVSVRVMGSAALGLAYTACGRLDLYIHLALYPWDLASGILLVSEAGGVVTELDGQPVGIQSKSVIATNRKIHQDFMGRSRG
ncbi:MAG TPA: inositol monophosphatase family protein [Dehalococcoidia bacterium]|nr:inositol monophosphatase family protein [Dehalococcoidia bacterium]